MLSPSDAATLFFDLELNPSSYVEKSEMLKGGTLFFSKSGWNGTISPYHWLIEL